MEKPTEEEFFVYFNQVEVTLPMREKTIQACIKLHGHDKLNNKLLKELQTIKKVSEWLQREHLGEFRIRYKE